MSKREVKYQHSSMDFKLRLLKEYYESGSSKRSLCKKYSVDENTFRYWLHAYESKGLSLQRIIKKLISD